MCGGDTAHPNGRAEQGAELPISFGCAPGRSEPCSCCARAVVAGGGGRRAGERLADSHRGRHAAGVGQPRQPDPARRRRATGWCSRCGSAGATRPTSTALLQAQYDPASPWYHRWLSPDAFHARYSPSQRPGRRGALVADRRGLRHRRRPRQPPVRDRIGHRRRRRAHVRRVREHVPHRRDDRPRAGRRPGRARGQIARDVRAITGLDGSLALATPEHNSPAPPAARRARRSARARTTGASTHRPCSPTRTRPERRLPWLICGYTPAQIDSAYGVSSLRRFGLDGRGQTIAITGAFFSPTTARRREQLLAPVRPAAAAGAGTTTSWSRPAPPADRRIRPRRRAGTSSRRSTSSGRMPSPPGPGSSTSAPRTTRAASTRRSTRSSTITWPASSRTAGACPSRSRRGARSWR